MAFLFCMTMVAGSFAATPQDVAKLSSGSNYPTHIIGLQDQTCKVGKTANFSGKLQFYQGVWTNAIWRHLTLTVVDNHGNVVSQETRMNNIFTATGHFKVNTKKLSLNPGKYNVIMSYAGNTGINACEATSTLTVTS